MDLDEFLNNFEKDFTRIIRTDFDKKVKEEYQKKTIESYDKYEPINPEASRYRSGRMTNFTDSNNHISEIKEDSKGVDYRLHNDTLSDCNCNYCRENEPMYIDMFIEDGIAGTRRITPKRVYEDLQEELDGASQQEVYDKLIAFLFNKIEQAGYEIK